ncbi:Bax inhibitor-1/YccA family protein [Qipengyuania sp. 1NDW9]|uniref:Bax inhibitor-1/YccA family protein n=2 Tax=Qipengyuania TaxID=1855416 RepID=A0A9Q3XC65_9SPHN|nr:MULTISPECIES: Bax inhibitor-1/YccA family protein [Qipengyuania]MBX7493699.1 Bax inhibitor-1/YccA family protein [Qipengyuania xiapuensis]MBY6129323.1 Bax inhibitor-1/YccA family protein [Qipengyuania aquimaris]MBY6217134.1 Bax inhibitor-1/YccA family protein [Qipengyuania aquimaris]QZD92195.1 Bax inhibitor-1/YccA family protein [Qipengyuania xiapuensis]UOR14279.1 Bax inhibitor-1/YccA family protein [Qipengyuania aquimaris]
MADWNDTDRSQHATSVPRAGDAVARGTTFDAGLRQHMLSIYNMMASGVLLTGIVSLLFVNTALFEAAFNVVQTPYGRSLQVTGLGWVIKLAPLAFILVISFGGVARFSKTTLQAMFWGFAVLMGLSLSTIFAIYTGESVASAFFAAAAAFAGLSLFGYTTKKNLSGWGNFLLMGLIGIIVAMLLNAFVFQSGAMGLVISILGVLIFAGFTAYDTQRLKNEYQYLRGTEMAGKAVVMGALSLYLDFINLFLFLLQFLGNRE